MSPAGQVRAADDCARAEFVSHRLPKPHGPHQIPDASSAPPAVRSPRRLFVPPPPAPAFRSIQYPEPENKDPGLHQSSAAMCPPPVSVHIHSELPLRAARLLAILIDIYPTEAGRPVPAPACRACTLFRPRPWRLALHPGCLALGPLPNISPRPAEYYCSLLLRKRRATPASCGGQWSGAQDSRKTSHSSEAAEWPEIGASNWCRD